MKTIATMIKSKDMSETDNTIMDLPLEFRGDIHPKPKTSITETPKKVKKRSKGIPCLLIFCLFFTKKPENPPKIECSFLIFPLFLR